MTDSHTRAAVILARGLGKRMRANDTGAALAADQMKAADAGMKGMIPIGRPFLDYLVSALADAGVERICLVIGPEHQAVVDHYTRASRPSRVSISFAIQEKPLGTADASLAAEKFCGNDSFIVINSDNYYPVPALAELAHTTPPAIAGFTRRALIEEGNVPPDRVTRFGALTIDDEGYLVRIVPRHGDPVATDNRDVYASMNCWLFDSRIFDACRRVTMSPRNELELPRAVQLAIDEMNVRVRVVKLDVAVLDMSSRGDIASVEEKLKSVNVRL
ncbi:MAG TPA: nucleotidyltransferase family protein [Gemmatimonadaceae bacterium]